MEGMRFWPGRCRNSAGCDDDRCFQAVLSPGPLMHSMVYRWVQVRNGYKVLKTAKLK